MQQPKVVDYYFAPMSGYAYLGHDAFVGLCADVDATIRYHPLDMGKVFAAAGSFPPAKYPGVRQVHRKADMARWAQKRGLPFNATPSFWPAPMELACAVITAAEVIDQATVSKAILSAVWVHNLNIADPADIANALKQHGVAADALLEKSRTPDIVAKAQATTTIAIEMGIFGSPTYVYDGAWYFGQDRLDFLKAAIAADT